MKKLFIKRLLKHKYIIVDENDNFICSIDKNKKSIVECLVVTCNNEEWFTVKYKQKFIVPGFQIYNKNTNLKITGTDSFIKGYKLTGTDIILSDVNSETDFDINNYYAYDFMLNNNHIGSITHPSIDYNHYYTIIINDDIYLKDIIAISTGILLCNYMKV